MSKSRNLKIIVFLFFAIICSGCVRSTFFNRKYEKMPASFERDILFHKKNSLEWWYFSGHLEDSAKRNYGFEMAIFCRYVPFFGHSLMLNYSLSKESDSSFYQYVDYVKLSRKNRKSATLCLQNNSKKNNWSLKQTTGGFDIEINAPKDQIPSIHLQTTSLKKPVFQAPQGYMNYGSIKNVGYFSYTKSAAKGKLLVDSTQISVNGQTWMDKQWNCIELTKKTTSWSWICLQIDSLNSEVMIFKSVNAASHETITQGTYIDEIGNSHFIENGDILIDTCNSWVSPNTFRIYPLVWQVIIPKYKLSFTVQPIFEDQEIPIEVEGNSLIVYWEGKSKGWGMLNGKPFTAKAFLEMTNQPVQKLQN